MRQITPITEKYSSWKGAKSLAEDKGSGNTWAEGVEDELLVAQEYSRDIGKGFFLHNLSHFKKWVSRLPFHITQGNLF